jgi:tetratricopeptide (TPR) repeat protein
MFASAVGQLREGETPDREELGRAARLAAEAALEQGRDLEALRYLDTALFALPSDPSTLDLMASLALRRGAYERARSCLETQLQTGALADEERIPVQLQLARACEGMGDLAAATRALEWVLERRPDDAVSRAHAVDLLERSGELDRALVHLDARAQDSPPELRARLALRAARLETRAGRIDTARRRLEALLEDWPGPSAAWIELAALAEQAAGPALALGVTERALQHVEAPLDRDALLWIQARALHQLGRIPDAMRLATQALAADPRNLEAGRLLAQHLGHAPDFRVAVQLLERALELTEPAAAVSSEMWEAVGRAYAGPLEDLPAAQRAYRRALTANPLRSSAREALADATAFDPAAHVESLHLHRDLLEAHPGRRASWTALERIAAHWQHPAALATCAGVRRALGATAEGERSERGGVAVRISDPEHSSVAAATELLRALDEAGALPAPAPRTSPRRIPGAIRAALARLAGAAWELADEQISALLQPPDAELGLGDSVARRVRRRVRRANRALDSETARDLSIDIWREELLAQAAACALDAGRTSISEALHALLEQAPLTHSLALRSGGDPSAAIPLCPPARALLLRIADGVLEALQSH